MSVSTCMHVSDIVAAPRTADCEKCHSTVNLRMCTECGHVGCCESQLAHNTAHYEEGGHAVIKSLPLSDDSFTWCYECNHYL